jgi:AcrR family transcriptional regulator
MPRVVDREQRRRHIAEAVFRLVGQRGLDGVGLREVAAEAGVSMGAVQHYFSSKQEMLLFALDHMTDRVLARLAASLGPEPVSRRDRISVIMQAMLPFTQASREEAAVNIAFFAAALGDPHYQQLLRDGYQRLVTVSIQQAQAAADAGELAPGLDPHHEGSALFYLIQGLIGPLLIGAITQDDAMALLEQRLDAMLPADTEPPRPAANPGGRECA